MSTTASPAKTVLPRHAALVRVKARLKPKQFQIFDLYALKEWPVKDVARALGVSATHVYVNKHRVAAMIKAELKRIERKMHPDRE